MQGIGEAELSALTVVQRIALAERLCESIRHELEDLPFTTEQLVHLRELVYRVDTGGTDAWVDFKRSLRGH